MCEEHTIKWEKTGEDRLSQSPLLLVSGSGSRPSSRSLAHFATENIKISSSRFTLEKNFELDLWACLQGGHISLISLL